MPVSRGGGFSGGGSHGSFSSNGTHSSTPTHISRRPYPGATMYVFINRHGQRSQFYSAVPPKRKKLSEIIVLMSIILLVAIGLCAMLIYSSYPRKMGKGYCDATGVYFDDLAGIVKDEKKFNEAMRSFYDKTGVEPYLLTTVESKFPSSVYGKLGKDTLEEYAYDQYLDRFDDEGHYMICYVVANDGTEMWLEMAGTDTTSLLDDTVFESLQENMSTKLYNSEDKSLAIAECLLIMADEAYIRTGFDIFMFVLGILIAVGGAVGVTLGTIAQIKQAQEIDDYFNYVENGGEDIKSESNDNSESIDFKDYI